MLPPHFRVPTVFGTSVHLVFVLNTYNFPFVPVTCSPTFMLDYRYLLLLAVNRLSFTYKRTLSVVSPQSFDPLARTNVEVRILTNVIHLSWTNYTNYLVFVSR